nr:DUF4390 domain-containing protein [Desulfobacterales bacterium]
MNLPRKKACTVLLCLLLLFSTNANSNDIGLSNIIISNTKHDLIIYFTVEGCFTDKLKKAILSGVPTTFTFLASLYRVRNFWPDKKIADTRVYHTIKYDNLKNEFHIIKSEEPGKNFTTKSFSEAQKLMAEIDSLVIAPLKMLRKDEHYQIRMKAELSKITLPFYLHYVFFLFLWDFETDWYAIDFTY